MEHSIAIFSFGAIQLRLLSAVEHTTIAICVTKLQCSALSSERDSSLGFVQATLEVDNDTFDPCHIQDISYDWYAKHTIDTLISILFSKM